MESERRPRRRVLPFVVLAVGLLWAAYLFAGAPRDHDVKVLLGGAADRVTGFSMQYVSEDGDLARCVTMAFAEGQAPRVIAHRPNVADGVYRVRIDLDTREGRRTVERQVTLGRGTTHVDLASVVMTPILPPTAP